MGFEMSVSLLDLDSGKTARISDMDEGYGFQKKLSSLNLRIGKKIRKITTQPFRGPVVVEVDNTKVALGQGMAGKIFVVENK